MNPFASEFVPTWGAPESTPTPAPSNTPAPDPVKAPGEAEEWNDERDGPMDPELAEELARIKAEEESESLRMGGRRKSSTDKSNKPESETPANADGDEEDEKSGVLSESMAKLLDQ